MSHLTIKMECDNDAFGQDPHQRAQEISRLMNKYIRAIQSGELNAIFRDINGNQVGYASFTDDSNEPLFAEDETPWI